MIRGIGTDLVRPDRIEQAIRRNPGFVDRVFTGAEQRQCEASASPWPRYAARFAAKEAFLKVCGAGLGACALTEIEIRTGPTGAPAYRLHGRARALMESRGICRVHLSMTHEDKMAAAFAVGEGQDAGNQGQGVPEDR